MRLRNPEVRLENCSACNAHCVICPREKITREKTVMPTEHFKGLVNQAVSLGAKTVSVFGYGEPLLDRDVAGKVRYCTECGLDTFITTNAALLTCGKAAELLEAGLSHIRFSCHGVWDNYESIHKPLKFNTFVRNVANFMKLNKDKYGHLTRVEVSVIPMHGETVEEITSWWEKWGLDGIEIWRPHNWAGGRNYRKVLRRKKSCGRPFNGPIQINADGKMMVCCFDTDATMTVGDTYTQSIEQILKGDAFEAIRIAHESGDLRGLICEQCDQLNEYEESPLLYSTIDPSCEPGKTSSCKTKLEEKK